MTVLSELLTASNKDQLSTREIARRAEKNGHTLAQPTVSKYMSGRHGKPTEGVLAAFSDVLNIPIDKLREAAGVPAGEGAPWSPPAEANRLDLRQRRALDELIRSMVTSETIGEDQTDDTQEHHDPASAAGGGTVEDPAQPDGITARFEERPWEQDEYGLAAKRGRNRGREARQRQDREAEGGGV